MVNLEECVECQFCGELDETQPCLKCQVRFDSGADPDDAL